MRIIRNAVTTIAVLLFATSVLAQDRKPISPGEMSTYVVSAKAGVVNVVEGAATVTRAVPFANPEMLISGDELRAGDIVKTVTGSRAEILLNPGCYLRLGDASEFVFLLNGSANDKIKLSRGSAIVEASAIDDIILVETPNANFEIRQVGLYRFNVAADGRSEIVVRNGRALVGTTAIRGGKRAIVEGGVPTIAALNKKELDDLDTWSMERARTLIATNKKLSNRVMKRSLAMGFASNSWIYDPFGGYYTFLPWTAGFASPYGGSYSVCNPYWYLPPWWRHHNDGGHHRRPGGGGGQPTDGGTQAGGNTGGGHGHPNRGGGQQTPLPRSEPPGHQASPPRGESAGRGFESHGAGVSGGAPAAAPSHEGGGKKH
jgi:hypothetical protein